jgi:ribosomal protein L7Ae-like RNA K-turn-binding protein
MKRVKFQLHYNDENYLPMIVKENNILYKFVQDGEMLSYWVVIDIFKKIMIVYEKYLFKPA